ncbi:MAG TPA: PrsW family glutamic-type intramembrane protease [Verrucomicrobiales bacterium]|nr:PrsW family glutamic-type intramembrane protease [Verrucomicrobiales bacterium]
MRYASRDTRFLGRTAMGIGLAAVATALVLSWFPWPERRPNVAQSVLSLRYLVMEEAPRGNALLVEAAQALTGDGPRELVSAYLACVLKAANADAGRSYLRTAAEEDPPARYANLFLGDLSLLEGNLEEGLRLYERETALPDAHYAAGAIAGALRRVGDKDRLRALLQDADFRDALTMRERVRAAVYLRDPAGLLRAVWYYDYTGVAWHVLLLTGVSAAVWFVILWKLYGMRGAASLLGWGGGGMLLGILSASATLFAVIWQEQVWGFETTGELVNDLVVWICGVGLREETIKLLFFLPLLPWLCREGKGGTALYAASCVGLGFALQENLGYLGGFYGEGAAWGRFLTANFLHLALTGLLGFAAFRFAMAPAREWERLLGTFVAVVLAHGFYNAFQSIPAFLQYDFPIFSIIVLAGVAHAYFVLAWKQRERSKQNISVLGVFVIGGATLLWLSLGLMGWRYGFLDGLRAFGPAFLGVFPLIFLFVRQFRDA